ncbi:unnamed protein product [Plutella xylostella]|uniref:(diamondback moth) hypothetical protein n=1 Tax=Plutella xylostella TaxID=51655 RepID=A0A8S4G708_PLUXY|nr:unnamed protein product [Plutella xylostella]
MRCADCDHDFTDGAQCGACKKHYDFKCAGVAESSYRKMKRLSWRCIACSRGHSSPTVQRVQPSLEDIMDKLNKLTDQLAPLSALIEDMKCVKQEIQEVKSSCSFMSSQLDDFVNKLKLIDGRVKDLEATKVELATTKEQLLSIQRSLLAKDQWSRANNVEIKGVPMKKTENLFKLVEAISTHVNYDFPKSQINYVSRLPTYNSKEKSILISFVNRYVKEDFVAAARGMKSIQASDIGFNDSNNRIFVNDHLSSEQKKLLNETKTAAKIKQHLYVWELECQILQSLLFCMHAFLTAKVASVDPAFLASIQQAN